MKLFFVILCLLLSLNLHAGSKDLELDIVKTKMSQQIKNGEWQKLLLSIKDIRLLGYESNSLSYWRGRAYMELKSEWYAYFPLKNYLEKAGRSGNTIKKHYGFI